MKAFHIESFGPDGLVQVDVPDLADPGPGQVLVRVRAASLNYRDLLMAQGLYNPKQPLPLVPLSDGAGEVAAVGKGVTRVKVGDRVAGIFTQAWLGGAFDPEYWRTSTLGGPLPGMLAPYNTLSENGVVPIPEHLSFEEAATLPCAAVTAWNALVSGNLQAGDTVLVQGTGGVSLFALQFARLMGARVIATSSSDEKLARVKAMGASDGINYKQTPDWDVPVRALTENKGVDHVVEVGGAGTLPRSLQAVHAGGRISLIGLLTAAQGAPPIDPLPILRHAIQVQGILVGSREMFEAMNRAITLHKLRPVIDRVFEFDQAPDAFGYLQSGAHFGKVVIHIT